ncbi:glycosyltransferase family 4 protein [Kaistella sp. BT6-1-3]|uniref:Glycosyltransferase family 4 protein n=1 Tax=Kaistella yananensis TaxID=2989820 RepID=A0ABT3JLN8_9FLAO|nr:glycosyltransferase family 4 protein [Kaistella yananensis]MCW4451699.1 glycosyltransferase family 4 protein [Kaistella yananensis]
MKVLVSVFNNLSTDQRVEKVCRTLSENGFSIELIGNNWGGLPDLKRDYPVSRIILKSKILRYAYVEFQWKLYKELLKKADQHTILLSNDLDTLLPNYMVSKKLNLPLVYDSHEIFTEMPSVNGRFTQNIWRSLESFIAPKLKFMMTASESYADWFHKTYGIERPVVVQNFPLKSGNPQDYSIVNSPKVIIYQGVINPSRGLDKLIPEMHKIENAELWIAGDGPKKKEFQELTKNLGLDDKVKFIGKILPEKLREITQKADLGVSIEENNGLSYYFSMPNKISDYIQARIPVVVSDFPEMRKVADHFKAGEKIRDYNELAQKIQLVLNNGKHSYKDALDHAASQLCWENEENRLLGLFGKIESRTPKS